MSLFPKEKSYLSKKQAQDRLSGTPNPSPAPAAPVDGRSPTKRTRGNENLPDVIMEGATVEDPWSVGSERQNRAKTRRAQSQAQSRGQAVNPPPDSNASTSGRRTLPFALTGSYQKAGDVAQTWQGSARTWHNTFELQGPGCSTPPSPRPFQAYSGPRTPQQPPVPTHGPRNPSRPPAPFPFPFSLWTLPGSFS